MTTTPTDADREAARAWRQKCSDHDRFAMSAPRIKEAFAAHRVAERERCAALAGAILRASASNYASENGSFALDNVAETIEEDLMEARDDQ